MRKTGSSYFAHTAIMFTVAFIAWSIYDGALREKTSGENFYHAGNKYFEDRRYKDALKSYQQAAIENPKFVHAHRGIARTLMQLGRNEEALNKFDEAISLKPNFGASYANRGILNDRLGKHEAAILDYKKAIQLDPKLAEGPSTMTRFLRNQAEKPPTILDRLNYLESELRKPKGQRLLKIPEKDEKQRPYKF